MTSWQSCGIGVKWYFRLIAPCLICSYEYMTITGQRKYVTSYFKSIWVQLTNDHPSCPQVHELHDSTSIHAQNKDNIQQTFWSLQKTTKTQAVLQSPVMTTSHFNHQFTRALAVLVTSRHVTSWLCSVWVRVCVKVWLISNLISFKALAHSSD